MSKYQEKQRAKAIDLVENSELFQNCKAGFVISRKEIDYPKNEILLDGRKNLFAPILNQVIEYFPKNKISFWKIGGEPKEKPTGHILSSQIACLNHLFPLRKDKAEVLKIAQIICKDIVDVLEIETDDFLPAYIAFEAVSDNDYLNESEKPTRGSHCTSIDALIYARHKNGKNYIFPIEWKYTEHYGNENKADGEKGEVRKGRYRDLINHSTQLKSENHKCYYFEPFYQLMRQTLWAEQMIAHRSLEKISAENFIHVHVIPQENSDLLDKKYPCSEKEMKATWIEHLHDDSKYKIISPKELLANIDTNKYSELKNYLEKRYW
jgi:hypothetical protein